jgi:hypothetical protein
MLVVAVVELMTPHNPVAVLVEELRAVRDYQNR